MAQLQHGSGPRKPEAGQLEAAALRRQITVATPTAPPPKATDTAPAPPAAIEMVDIDELGSSI